MTYVCTIIIFLILFLQNFNNFSLLQKKLLTSTFNIVHILCGYGVKSIFSFLSDSLNRCSIEAQRFLGHTRPIMGLYCRQAAQSSSSTMNGERDNLFSASTKSIKLWDLHSQKTVQPINSPLVSVVLVEDTKPYSILALSQCGTLSIWAKEQDLQWALTKQCHLIGKLKGGKAGLNTNMVFTGLSLSDPLIMDSENYTKAYVFLTHCSVNERYSMSIEKTPADFF